jgi:hypothetical protein
MLIHHPALEGNSLKVLRRMDIPGLDLLTSWPEAAIHSGWMTATLPASAALFNGGRRVMTEVSDFSETMAGKAPASVEDMCATAAWQAAFGVTEFTLYYDRGRRTAAEYNAYNTFVGRLNALLREARPAPRVLLYYPIDYVWTEYKPVAGKLTAQSQSPRLRRIADSFMDLGRRMTRRQIPFALAEYGVLGDARVEGSQLRIGDHRFRAVVLPAETQAPLAVVRHFEMEGGCVLREKAGEKLDLSPLDSLNAGVRLNKPAERLVAGRFTRDGRELILIVNIGTEALDRMLLVSDAAKWVVADPATGETGPARVEGPDEIALALPPKAARVFIGPAGS